MSLLLLSQGDNSPREGGGEGEAACFIERVTFPLTFVSVYVTWQISLIEGRFLDAILKVERVRFLRAGFAPRSRAVRVSSPPAL